MVMERKHMKKRLGLGIATALAAMSFGQQALAQAVPPPWSLNGSDTWFDVITQALIQANTDCPGTDVTNTISNLHYAGGGSGTGETNLLNNKQSIAPMSRNFKGAIIGTGGTHTNWTPTLRNVGGLDAAVVDTKGGANRIKNIQLPTPVGVTNEAAPNDPAVPCDFGTQGSCYTQLMGIVLGGTDGSGSVAACSSPARVQAILDLAALQHVSTIEHFYRRDDNSGTTDTIKEKLKIANFCNGRARGILGSNTVDPTNNNLNNQDNDPIRRACPAPSASFRANKCTDFTTGLICTFGRHLHPRVGGGDIRSRSRPNRCHGFHRHPRGRKLCGNLDGLFRPRRQKPDGRRGSVPQHQRLLRHAGPFGYLHAVAPVVPPVCAG